MRAASFYLLSNLHAECLSMLKAALSIRNVLPWQQLLFAAEHHEEDLKAAALAVRHVVRRSITPDGDQLPQPKHHRIFDKVENDIAAVNSRCGQSWQRYMAMAHVVSNSYCPYRIS